VTVGTETGIAVAAPHSVPRSAGSGGLLSRLSEVDATLVLRAGLAVLFGANAAVAWIDPGNFTSLLNAARFDRLVDPWVFIWVIRVNDILVAIALVFAWKRWPTFVPAWAGLYLLTVAATKVAALA
jgi:hypothetical protein